MLMTINNVVCHVSDNHACTLNRLADMRPGGFATVKAYKPSTGYTKIPTIDLQFISRFSTHRVYERKIAKLKELTFDNGIFDSPKLKGMTNDEQVKLFESCKQGMIDSMNKSIGGIIDSAQREAHEKFYATMGHGVKVHFETQDGADGNKELVLYDGLPKVQSIMLTFLEIGRKVIVDGEYKVVNSGPKVLMDNAINKALGKTLSIKTISLKTDNHDELRIGGEVIDASLHDDAMAYVD